MNCLRTTRVASVKLQLQPRHNAWFLLSFIIGTVVCVTWFLVNDDHLSGFRCLLLTERRAVTLSWRRTSLDRLIFTYLPMDCCLFPTIWSTASKYSVLFRLNFHHCPVLCVECLECSGFKWTVKSSLVCWVTSCRRTFYWSCCLVLLSCISRWTEIDTMVLSFVPLQ